MTGTVSPTAWYFPKNGRIPNNPTLPALLYRNVLDVHAADKEKKFQRHLEESGWRGIWKNGLYDYIIFIRRHTRRLALPEGALKSSWAATVEKL